MRLRSLFRGFALLGLLLSACAPSYAAGYQAAFAEGLRARNAGRYEEAREAFQRAADLGDRYKDREEARMLVADSLEHLGDSAAAEETYRQVVTDADGRYQGARAAFAVARLVLDRDGLEAGNAETIKAIRLYPNSGLVRHAVRRLLALVEEQGGPQAALEWLRPLELELRASDSGEAVSYELATLLARCELKAESVDSLLTLARSHPYPNGSMTDDAYFAASLFLEDLGRLDEAIAVLEEMLSPQEAAYNGSSYDRPRWPAAAYRLGVLQRDQKRDVDAAIRAFWRVYDRHRTSRVTDDALFEVARLEAGRGAEDKACAAIETLRTENADSKFLRCGHFVCKREKESARVCSSDVLRKLGLDPDTVWESR